MSMTHSRAGLAALLVLASLSLRAETPAKPAPKPLSAETALQLTRLKADVLLLSNEYLQATAFIAKKETELTAKNAAYAEALKKASAEAGAPASCKLGDDQQTFTCPPAPAKDAK